MLQKCKIIIRQILTGYKIVFIYTVKKGVLRMENTYLPSTIRDRLQDLMKKHKVTQSELATKIDSTVSVIRRFLTSKTDKLSDVLLEFLMFLLTFF